MPLVTRAQAPRISLAGLTAYPMAVPSRGSAELAIWYLRVEPGAPGARHTVDREEVFVVQRGAMVAELDGAEHPVGPGDALVVPPGVPFSMHNPGPEPAELLVCTSAGVLATLDGQVIEPPWSR